MIVYQYDCAGLYVGPVNADESPREPGTYLLPARCTKECPPAIPDGCWPRWNGAAWDMIPSPYFGG